MRVFIFGANGLLGRHIEAEFIYDGINPIHISRKTHPTLEAKLRDPKDFIQSLGATRDDVIINALGVTRHRIEGNLKGSDSKSVELINTRLPLALASQAQETGTQVIQIGTDCVFSGERGDYVESDPYDASDTYGRSKAIGESAQGLDVIRASSVGPSGRVGPQLWDWVKNQQKDSTIAGYSNVFWNGVTAKVHARLLLEIVKNRFPIAGTQHLVPANQISKEQLIKLIAQAEGRRDIRVLSTHVEHSKNMTLSTENISMNSELWNLIGFPQPPDIEELILNNSSNI